MLIRVRQPRFVVLGPRGTPPEQALSRAMSSSRLQAVRKGLKTASTKPSVDNLNQSSPDELYLSVYKQKVCLSLSFGPHQDLTGSNRVIPKPYLSTQCLLYELVRSRISSTASQGHRYQPSSSPSKMIPLQTRPANAAQAGPAACPRHRPFQIPFSSVHSAMKVITSVTGTLRSNLM
jgi:hypothetical protein